MNRRDFIKFSFATPVLFFMNRQNIDANKNKEDGLLFPVVFSENTVKTNEVSISYIKSNNIFEQLWQDIQQIIR